MNKEVTKTGGPGWSIEQTIENMTPNSATPTKPLSKAEPTILESDTPLEPKLNYTPPERVCIFTGERGDRQRFLNGKIVWLSDEAYEKYTTGEIVEQLNRMEKEWLKNLQSPKQSSSSEKSLSESPKQSKKQLKK